MIKNGILRLKSAVGTTWAGRVMHAQSAHPGKVYNGRVVIERHAIENSVLTNLNIVRARLPVEEFELIIYHDNSALFVEKGKDTPGVLPFLYFIAEKIKIDGKNFHLSIQDVLEPKESCRFQGDQAQQVEDQIQHDLADQLAKALKKAPTTQPWFLACDAREDQDINTLSALMAGLKMMGVSVRVKGRLLKPNAIPGPLRLEQDRRGGWTYGLGEHVALRAMFDHPNFLVPKERQVHQGWDNIRSGNDTLCFTNLDLAGAIGESAHQQAHALYTAQQALEHTNTSLEDLK